MVPNRKQVAVLSAVLVLAAGLCPQAAFSQSSGSGGSGTSVGRTPGAWVQNGVSKYTERHQQMLYGDAAGGGEPEEPRLINSLLWDLFDMLLDLFYRFLDVIFGQFFDDLQGNILNANDQTPTDTGDEGGNAASTDDGGDAAGSTNDGGDNGGSDDGGDAGSTDNGGDNGEDAGSQEAES